jgi:hypothetical protein
VSAKEKALQVNKITLVVFIASLGLGSAAFADVEVFSTPTGDLTTTHTYSLDGVNIVATGFNGGDLWGKADGGDENGVGLANDPGGDHEIYHVTSGAIPFIQIDLLNLINAGFAGFQFQMNSTTSPDGWSVSACSSGGTDCGTSAVTGSDEGVSHSVPTLSATNHYLDFSATAGNVLLKEITATRVATPEPRFYGFLLAGMMALVGIVRGKLRSAEQA